MILSDRTIREELAAGRIVIEGLQEGAIQPSSVDLHVDRYFRVFRNHTMRVIDVKEDQENLTELVEMLEDEAFILHPGEFVLGSTAERVRLPDDLVARLEGKSSLGRLGLLIHSSLPGGEQVMVLGESGLSRLPIQEIVHSRLRAKVLAFDPITLEIRFHHITGWYEGPPDRIFEVVLETGRSVRVTGGHNLFTPDGTGGVRKIRTAELRPGCPVAVPEALPEFASLQGSPGRQLVMQGVPAAPHAARPLLDPDPQDSPRLSWETVVEVRDTGQVETIFDLEVRPDGRRIENFLAGTGGVFVSNTAGFVDAGFDGHLTLELSNVANLPITLYPGMKIGQISFLRMTTPAESPYGSKAAGSKYQGQRGPTPSRYSENFRPRTE